MDDYDDFLYPHQRDAIQEIKKYNKCLVNMWCSTGKTRVFTILMFMMSKKNNVFVFPSLGLINQYNNDYFLSKESVFVDNFKKYNCIAFCSDDESKLKERSEKITYSTNENYLKKFISSSGEKIFLVTYASLKKFIDVFIESKERINRLVYDEAHHSVAKEIKNTIYGNESFDSITDKTEFYTATPVNKHGVVMFDYETYKEVDGNCGPLAYEYLYHQAFKDGICKEFDTRINLYMIKPNYKTKYQPIFEQIIRCCLSGEYDYWNVLTFHTFVNETEGKDDNDYFYVNKKRKRGENESTITYVAEFSSEQNQEIFKELFQKIQEEEYPNTKVLFKIENVILKGVSCKTTNRKAIIEDFDRKVPGRIYILSSCGILNEGIDTKWANVIVPINPTMSIVKESQRIGRIVRLPEKDMPNSIVLLPCLLNFNEYENQNDPKVCDQMIRDGLSKNGNFDNILNVISAFRYQQDRELFEMCLRYPNNYSPGEIFENLNKQGLYIEENKGDLIDNVIFLFPESVVELNELRNFDSEQEHANLELKIFDSKTKKMLILIGKTLNRNVELHTQSYETPILHFNNEDSNKSYPVRLCYAEDNQLFYPIVEKSKIKKSGSKGGNGAIEPPEKRRKLFEIKKDNDLEAIWKISDQKLSGMFGTAILDVEVSCNVIRWKNNLQKVTTHIETYNKIPTESSKNYEEKKLAGWVSSQKMKEKRNIGFMKNEYLKSLWENTLTKYPLLQNKKNIKKYWKNNLQKVVNYIEENNQLPSYKSNLPEDKIMMRWICVQRQHFKAKDEIMKHKDIRYEWEKALNLYPLLQPPNFTEIWLLHLQDFIQFIELHKKAPREHSNNSEEKKMLHWFVSTKKNYYNHLSIMKDQNVRNKWEDTINLYPILKEKDVKEEWENNLQKVIEFIEKNNKLPRPNSNILEYKSMAYWIGTQRKKYKKKNFIMKDKEIRQIWENALELYPLLKEKDKKEVWKYNLQNAILYIEKNNAIPSVKSVNIDEKEIIFWIKTQRTNFKSGTQIMKDKEIFDQWEKAIQNYPLLKGRM